MNKLLIVFVKNPEIGKVKTRLAKNIGDEAALAVYLKLLTRTHEVINDLKYDKAVYYSEYIDSEDNWQKENYQKYLQKGKDLGARMGNAIQESLDAGYDSVCLIGTDIYALTSEIINDAFYKLESHDVVIGPAEDGGYYLIGMNAPYSEIFQLERWSTSDVFEETLKLIKKNRLTYGLTAQLNDIDHLEDLKGTDLLP